MPNPPPAKVTLAWIHPSTVSHLWARSVTNLRIWDLATAKHTAHEYGELFIRCAEGAPSDSRAGARNIIVRRWLDECDADYLLWLDTDMGFDKATLDLLLAHERPIMGALCFGLVEAGDSSFGGIRTLAAPTIYDLNDAGRFNPRADYQRHGDAIQTCHATGSACILIRRDVFVAIREKYGDVWYKQATVKNEDGSERVLGEDLSFCLRAKGCGFDVRVDPKIKTTHDKGGAVFLDEAFYDAQANRSRFVDPATDRVDVIVPVLHRPQNVRPFMESLKATTGLADVWFIVEEGDDEEMEAVARCGGGALWWTGTFAEKVNYAYKAASSDPFAPPPRWIFLCGDDVVFRPGWLDQALATAHATGAKVIGTNDLANSRVMKGGHATHMLIARDYIDEVGASWDGPGIVCHEGYRHWYVDDEIVTAAKQRGVWAPCLASIVEHMHPIAGKAEDDEVYRLGRSEADADRRRFQRRLLTYGS